MKADDVLKELRGIGAVGTAKVAEAPVKSDLQTPVVIPDSRLDDTRATLDLVRLRLAGLRATVDAVRDEIVGMLSEVESVLENLQASESPATEVTDAVQVQGEDLKARVERARRLVDQRRGEDAVTTAHNPSVEADASGVAEDVNEESPVFDIGVLGPLDLKPSYPETTDA